MKHRMAIILGSCLLVSLAAHSVAAQDLFYTGEIIIADIEVILDIGSEAVVTAEYVLTNRGDVEESVTLGGKASRWACRIGRRRSRKLMTPFLVRSHFKLERPRTSGYVILRRLRA
jgi:hypothetical protein